MSKEKYIYIDECGDTSLNVSKEGVSSHFILAAIIVDADNINNLVTKIEEIRLKHFQTGEMKSKSIKSRENHKRRKRILSDLESIDFKYYVFIADKENIKSEGLPYKKSFIKFMHNKVYTEFELSFEKIKIFADEHGSEEFMQEFSKFVHTKHPTTLLELCNDTEFNFTFTNSKDSVLIQLADLIAGTISFGYEKNKLTDEFNQFEKLLSSKQVLKKIWPTSYEKLEHELNENTVSEYDSIIAKTSLNLATKYIRDNVKSKDSEIKEKVLVLRYLLNKLDIKNGTEYTSSYEIINHLKNVYSINRSHRYFRTKIVAKLRDSGLLISSSNQGYKIPLCKKDIYKFVDRTNSNILPMFSRLKKARERILLATSGELDILDEKEYSKLKLFLDNEA